VLWEISWVNLLMLYKEIPGEIAENEETEPKRVETKEDELKTLLKFKNGRS
jgi:hypothetical protein